MKLKSRIAGSATALALALGMSAAPAFAAAPVVSDPERTAYDQGTMSSRGNCSTIAVGTILNVDKTAGLGLIEEALTSSSKGYPRNSEDVGELRIGQCAVETSAGFSGGEPTGFGEYVNKDVAKFGTKLTGISDCLGAAIEPVDLEERPLTGKLSITFTDLTKLAAYIRIQGFDTEAADMVWLTGIVAKGEGVGTTIGGSVWFNPAYKAKTATGYFGSTPTDDPKTVPDETLDPTQVTAAVTIAPGYATGAIFTVAEALACSEGTGDVGLIYGVPGLDLIGLGGGDGFPSPALGTDADGIQFLL